MLISKTVRLEFQAYLCYNHGILCVNIIFKP